MSDANKVELTYSQLYNQRLRQRIFDIYGYACECCGITEPTFLTVQHRNNDGAAHKRRLSKRTSVDETGHYRVSSDAVYRDLLKRESPDPSIGILCWNCNYASYRGTCPHQVV